MIPLRRLSRSTPLVAIVTAAALAACAAPRSTHELAPLPQNATRARGGLEVLTSAQLAAAGPGLSLYEAVSRLRPGFLDGEKGRPDGPFPVAYVDGRRVPDVQRLRYLSCERVRKVQILDPERAAARYGSGHEGGAILVSLTPDRR